MKKIHINLDVANFFKEEKKTVFTEQVAVPVTLETYEKLQSLLGREKNEFIRYLIDQALPVVEEYVSERKSA